MKKVVVVVVVIAVVVLAGVLALQPFEKASSAYQVVDSFGHAGWWVEVQKGHKEGVAVGRLYKEFGRQSGTGPLTGQQTRYGHAWVIVADAGAGDRMGTAIRGLLSAHPLARLAVELCDKAIFREHESTVAEQRAGDAQVCFCSWSCPVSRVKIAILALLPAYADVRQELQEMAGGCHTYSLGYKDLGSLPNPPRVCFYNPFASRHRDIHKEDRPAAFQNWWALKTLEGLWLEWRPKDTPASPSGSVPSVAGAEQREPRPREPVAAPPVTPPQEAQRRTGVMHRGNFQVGPNRDYFYSDRVIDLPTGSGYRVNIVAGWNFFGASLSGPGNPSYRVFHAGPTGVQLSRNSVYRGRVLTWSQHGYRVRIVLQDVKFDPSRKEGENLAGVSGELTITRD